MHKSFIWLSGIALTFIMLSLFVVFEKFILISIPANILTRKSEIENTEIFETSELQLQETETIDSEQYTEYEAFFEENKSSEDRLISFFNGDQISFIKLEDFVLGALSAEMPSSFDTEALKAQAVAIRTYAMRKQLSYDESSLKSDIHSDAALCGDSNHCCAYISPEDFLQKYGESAVSALEKFKSAVDETAGEVITYNGKLIDAVFHSRSFRSTESAEELWGYDIPYLRAVQSPEEDFVNVYIYSIEEFCTLLNSAKDTEVSKTLNAEKNISDIIFTADDGDSISFVRKLTAGGRVKNISIGQTLFSGNELRNGLSLPSSMFEIYEADEKIVITTHGSGHGVGMSQYGADTMAKNGYSYSEIIKHYYSGCDIHYLYKIFT